MGLESWCQAVAVAWQQNTWHTHGKVFLHDTQSIIIPSIGNQHTLPWEKATHLQKYLWEGICCFSRIFSMHDVCFLFSRCSNPICLCLYAYLDKSRLSFNFHTQFDIWGNSSWNWLKHDTPLICSHDAIIEHHVNVAILHQDFKLHFMYHLEIFHVSPIDSPSNWETCEFWVAKNVARRFAIKRLWGTFHVSLACDQNVVMCWSYISEFHGISHFAKSTLMISPGASTKTHIRRIRPETTGGWPNVHVLHGSWLPMSSFVKRSWPVVSIIFSLLWEIT